MWSALVILTWSSRPQICCRSCGVKNKISDALFCFFLGWWGFPHGLIMTPIQLGRNLFGIFSMPDPSRPSTRWLRWSGRTSRPNSLQSNSQKKQQPNPAPGDADNPRPASRGCAIGMMNGRRKSFSAIWVQTALITNLTGTAAIGLYMATSGEQSMREALLTLLLSITGVAVFTLLPTLCYAAILTAIGSFALARGWSRRILYPVAAVLSFGAFVWITRYIPPRFGPEPRQAFIELEELPLLGVFMLSGVIGASVCARLLRRGKE